MIPTLKTMMAAFFRDPRLREKHDSGKVRAMLRKLLAGARKGGK